MSDRATLHRGKLEEFLTWAESQGYERLDPLGPCEVARLRGAGGLAHVYARDRGDHLTVFALSEQLVVRWLRSRRRSS